MTKTAAMPQAVRQIGHARPYKKWVKGVSKNPILMPDDLRALGKNIEARRTELKITQAELAKAAGVSERTLLNIENCSMNGWPSSPVFLRISRKLGLPDPELFSTK